MPTVQTTHEIPHPAKIRGEIFFSVPPDRDPMHGHVPTNFVLYAAIKADSPHAYQGRTEEGGRRILFPVQGIKWPLGVGNYIVRLNENVYTTEDLEFFLSHDGKEFLRL